MIGRGERDDAPSAPSIEERTDRRRRRAAQNLRWSVDHPPAGAEVEASTTVTGWAFHLKREVTGVVVMVNGRVAGATAPATRRLDVLAAYPDHPAAERSGWSVPVVFDPADGPDQHVEVLAVLTPDDGDGDPARLSLTVPIHSATVRVAVDPDQIGGGPDGLARPSATILGTHDLTPGFNRVQGLVDVPGEVDRVVVTCDGVPADRVRTSLPGSADRADVQPSARIALFEAGIDVDGPGEVEIAGTVHCVGGRTVEITPVTRTVREPLQKGPSPRRLEAVRKRIAERGALMAPVSALPTGTTPPTLVVTHDLGLGGGQLWLHELVLRLHARGVPIAMTSLRGGELLERMEELGIPVLVTGGLDAQVPEGYEAHVQLVTDWAREHGCHTAIANTMSALTGVDAATRLGLPVAWAIHESFPLGEYWTEAFGSPVPAYPAERGELALGLADIAVFEAQATLDLYAPYLREGAGHVVPYGVDLSAIADYAARNDRGEVRRRLGFDDSTLVLLCVGTVEPRKAQIKLAQAFLGSEELKDRDVALVFVGAREGSAYVAALEGYVWQFHEDRVRIEPAQPDVYQWYHAADVLLCASDIESLPRTMLEAMGFGTAVASTAVFGIPELITDGETGFLCSPDDLSSLRSMLERVATTPRTEIEAVGARGRDLVLTRHDPAVYEEFFLEWLMAQTHRLDA